MKRRTVPQPTIPSTVALSTVRKVCDFSPVRPCLDAVYGPCLVRHPISGRLFLYVMGGHIDEGMDPRLTSYKRFAEKIWVTYSDDDGANWTPLVVCIGKSSFPWMDPLKNQYAEEWLAANPQAFIGCVGSPSVVIDGSGIFRMHLSATVADQNVTTGDDHAGTPTPYGSRSEPTWPFYAAFEMISADGLNFAPINYGRRESENVALQHASFYAEPLPGDLGFGHPREFVGTYQVSAMLWQGALYRSFLAVFPNGQKCGMLRSSSGDQRLWNGAGWEPLVGGRLLPRWFVEHPTRGQYYSHLPSQILPSPWHADQFLVVAEGATPRGDGSYIKQNRIEYAAFGEDMRMIGDIRFVESPLPLFDGRAPEKAILTPAFYVTASGLRVLFSTNCDSEGKTLCDGAGYVGASIWEARA